MLKVPRIDVESCLKLEVKTASRALAQMSLLIMKPNRMMGYIGLNILSTKKIHRKL